jgi:hypothetical protein
MAKLNSRLRPRQKLAAPAAGWLAVIAVSLAFGLMLLDSISVSGSEQPALSTRMASVQGGSPPLVALMFTGEVMGWTEPCG